MAGRKPAVEVEGAPQLQRAFRRLEDRLDTDLRDTDVGAAEIVASTARSLVVVRSGGLLGSIRVDRHEAGAAVLAGNSGVPYAGVNHYGWPARNIVGNPFIDDAITYEQEHVVQRYDDGVSDLLRKFDREAP